MYCDSFTCSMKVRACRANQVLAKTAIDEILSQDQTVFQLTDQAVNRMVVCGKCDQSNIDPGRAKEAFRRSITVLADKITTYNEWGFDPEVTEAKRKENPKVKGERAKIRDKDRRTDLRIEQLKKEVDHDT